MTEKVKLFVMNDMKHKWIDSQFVSVWMQIKNEEMNLELPK